MSARAQIALHALLWTALAAAVQLVATVHLGLARPAVVAAAAAEPAWPYLAAVAAVAAGIALAVVGLRRRPLLTAVAILALEASVLAPAGRRMTAPGLAYHLELFAHHWAAVAGVSAHVVSHARGFEPARTVHAAAAGLLAAAALATLVARARAGRDLRRTILAAVLLAPWALRIALAGSGGLAGAPVEGVARPVLAGSMAVAALAAYAFVRPRLSLPLYALVQGSSALAVAVLYVTYTRFFGEVDAAFDELARSFLAFSPPYPSYVPTSVRLAFALAVFCTIATIHAATVSADRRREGLALAVLVLAGVGLSSPQTVLMAGAGWLAVVAWIVPADPPPQPHPPPVDAVQVLREVAEGFGWEPPVVLDTPRGRTLAAEGTVTGMDVRIRGRERRGRLEVTVEVGLPVEGRPRLSLEPAPPGVEPRPLHPIAATHRVRGQPRALEALDEAVLDALLAFPRARAAWSATGLRVDLGDDLRRFEPPQVRALVEAAVRTVA